ncbi:MAG: UDP-N-acetylglucosamine 1-carboxyvinyltransferase, partial [Chloroflexi bacterium]
MRIVVHGGVPLQGTFQPSGNSNAALALTAAALLTDAPVTLTNVPDTLSTAVMFDAARVLGTTITRDGDSVQLQTAALHTRELERDLIAGQVSTVLLLAPVLARRRHARLEIDYPLSRLHTHLVALRDLGVNIRASGGVIDFQADPWDKKELLLLQASVTTTALVSMLAAALGRETIVRNAASEPHIQDLLHLLSAMGVEIDGIGSNVLHIRGVEQPGGASARLSPDHIEAASVAALGAITHGSVTIEGIIPDHLRPIGRVYARLGMTLHLNGDTLFLPPHDKLIASQLEEELDVPIETAPWPGFPSDLIAMAT